MTIARETCIYLTDEEIQTFLNCLNTVENMQKVFDTLTFEEQEQHEGFSYFTDNVKDSIKDFLDYMGIDSNNI